MTGQTCPSCGAERLEGASFCEACAHEFSTSPDGSIETVEGAATIAAAPAPGQSATPTTAPPGEESPLDVGWTGRTVVGAAGAPQNESAQGTEP